MNSKSKSNETVKSIFKASLVGILAVVFTVIPFEQFFGISFAEFGGSMPTAYLVPLFLIYVAMALVLAKMKENLYVSKRGAFFKSLPSTTASFPFCLHSKGKSTCPIFPSSNPWLANLSWLWLSFL